MATTTTSGLLTHENIPPTNPTSTSTTFKAISCSSSSCSSSDLVAAAPIEESMQITEIQSQEAASSNDHKPTTNGTEVNGDEANKKEEKKTQFKVEIPKISSSRELRPQRPISPPRNGYLDQIGLLFNGPGSERDLNKSLLRIRSVELEEGVKKARKYAMEQSVRYALVKQQQQQQKQQLDLIKKQQAILLMCRIYVGSIFYEVKEEQVRSAFGQFGPIRSISMSWDVATNKHKGFAFIEFETPEAAQLSLDQMNGSLMGGRNIKVGRPSNMPQAQPIIDQLMEDAKRHHRIYVSSIHPGIGEQDVQSVFEAFGKIKSCALARDIATGKHKGYGFIEFESAEAAQDAINGMNMLDLGGQLLRVGKAITPPETVTPPNSSLLNQPFGGYAGAAAAATATLSPSLNTLTATGTLNTPGMASKLSEITSGSSFSNLTQLTPSSSTSSLPASSSTTTLASNKTSSSTNLITESTSTSTSSQGRQNGQHVNQETQQDNSASLNSPGVQSQALSSEQLTTESTTADSGSSISLTENQRKLLGLTGPDDTMITLDQQVELTLKGKEQRLILMKKLMSRRPESKVVVLKNMVGPEDVDDSLETEITDECEKFGPVERVVIYQEKQGEEEDAQVIVKIFVEFVGSKSVEVAVNALNGRFFAGRKVKAEVYDQVAYDSKDYSG